MRDLRPVSYRVILLASVASVALGGSAGAASYNNTSPVTNAGPSYTLHSGDTLSNSSSITATGAAAAAVLVGPGASSISNSGLIQSTGANGAGIQVVSGGSVGTIINAGTLQSTTGNAILVGDTLGSVNTIGTISNSALIQSSGTNAAIQVGSGDAVVLLQNNAAGTIQALGSANAINVLGTIGTINNSGLVQASAGAGIGVASSGSIGAITNSGTITGGAAGILNNGTIGTIGNTGSISSITNSATGSIRTSGTAAGISDSGTIGSILNSGTIMSPQGAGINIAAGGSITAGIINAAGGLIQGGPSNGSGTAIDDSAGTNALSITTAGTIVGAIKLGPAGDTLNVTGGSITGAIIGQSGSHDILNFNAPGTFTTGGSIANVDTINVNTNTVVVQQSVSSAIAFNVAAGATAALNASVQATNFNNAGEVNVGSGVQTITGSYNQANGAVLGVTVTGTGASGAGRLNVTGAATIANGTNSVAVHVPTSADDFALVGNSYTVLAASTLAVTGSLSATSDNSGISFGLTDTSQDLILSGLQQSASQINAAATNAVTTIFAPITNPTPDQVQAQHFLTDVFVGLAESGQTKLVATLDSILTSLTPTQVVQLNNQLMPSTVESGETNLFTTTNVLGGGEANVLGHLTTARLSTTQTGLAAGDPVPHGFTFWGQPFGAVTSQGAHDGFDGYDAGTYGVTLGADTLVTPQIRAGVALTLSNANLSYNGSLTGNTGSVFTGELDAYGTWNLPNNFFIDGLLGVGINHYTRHDLISALGVALDSSNGGTVLTAKIGAGYDWKLRDGAVLTPYASLQQFHFNFGSYTTTGGSAYDVDMHVNSETADITQSRLGARLTYPVKLPNGGAITPEVHAYWLHDFGSNQLTSTYTTSDFVSPSTFTAVGPPNDRDMINIGIGATFLRGPGWSFSGGYDYLGTSSLSGHNFYVTLKVDF